MSYLKIKSEENLKAANHLFKTSLYAPSIHCSYYACVQKMLHILQAKYNMTQVEIDEEQKQVSEDLKGGIHSWLINKFYFLLLTDKKTLRSNASRNFSNKINELKNMRINADYKDKAISRAKSTDCIMQADELITILDTYFTI